MQKNKKIFAGIAATTLCAVLIGVGLANRTPQFTDIADGATRRVAYGVVIITPDEIPLAKFPEQSMDDLADEIVALTNKIRVENGLNELQYTSRLAKDASIRAEELEIKWSHTRPNNTKWFTVDQEAMYGENLGRGYADAETVVQAWMDSPTHRDNLLFSDFKTIGVSIYIDDDGYYWIAQEFGY